MSTTQGGPGNIVTNGLVLYLDAANPTSYPYTGSTWFDLSGQANNGTLVNGTTYNSLNGGSIVFDGVDDYVGVNNVLGGITNYSAEFWFKLTTNTINSEKWLGSQYPGGGGVGRLIFMVFTNNRLRNFINGTGIDGVTTLLTNTWYHAVFTRNSVGSATIFLNGVLDGSGTISTVPVLSHVFQIGGSTVLVSRWLNGNIPIVRLYNRTLSPTEIAQNFNSSRARFGI
jgi:hypothetical protein